MAQINWEEIEAVFSFKQVEDGEYTTQVTKIEVSDTPSQSGNYSIRFELKDLNGARFPYSASHWISFKNDNWRIHHLKSLLRDMGVSEENARKYIENCELAGDKEAIVDAYRIMFSKLVSTNPKAKVKVETQPYIYTYKEDDKAKGKRKGDKEIRLNGHRTEFAGDSYMSPTTIDDLKKRYPNTPVEGETQTTEPLDGEAIDLSTIPF